MPSRPRWRDVGADGGQATVELAVGSAFVVVLLLAIVHVGLVVRDQVLVTHAAREAARAAAVGADPVAAATAAGPLDPAGLTVRVARVGTIVHVTVTYRSDPGLAFIGAVVGPRTLQATAVMTAEPGT